MNGQAVAVVPVTSYDKHRPPKGPCEFSVLALPLAIALVVTLMKRRTHHARTARTQGMEEAAPASRRPEQGAGAQAAGA